MLVWFEVDDYAAAVARAHAFGAHVIEETVDATFYYRELWLRGPNWYFVVISRPGNSVDAASLK